MISSFIRKNGGDDDLVEAVAEYLEHGHPRADPPWSQEFDDICQNAVAWANSKQERLRKHKKRTGVAKAKQPPAPLNNRNRPSLAQERHAIRQALRRPDSRAAHRMMLARLEELEKLIANSVRA